MKRFFFFSLAIVFCFASCKEKKAPPPPPVETEEVAEVMEQDTSFVEEDIFQEITPPAFTGNRANDKYFLIAGSFMEYGNAEQCRQDLINKGMRSEIIQREQGPNSDFYKVSYMSFSNWKEALQMLENERSTPGKENVWLLVKR
jgi:cell division protein FtsN